MVLWQPRKKDIVHKIFMSERAIPFTTCLSCTCAWVIHSRDSYTLAYYYRTHTNSHTNVHTQSLTYIQTKLNSGCQHTHMQIDTHYIYAHAHAHTHIHTHTHTCTHIHTHTCTQASSCGPSAQEGSYEPCAVAVNLYFYRFTTPPPHTHRHTHHHHHRHLPQA